MAKHIYKYQLKITDDDRDTILWALNLKRYELSSENMVKHKLQLEKIAHAMSVLQMPEEIQTK